MTRQKAGSGSVLGLALAWSACSPLADFPDSVSESTAETCTDGQDNDLDGRVDCEDEDCGCNRCPEFVESEPFRDGLGRECARDCECTDGGVCNLDARFELDADEAASAGRCISAADANEDEFDIHFTVAIKDGPTNGLTFGEEQNVLGRARFDGADDVITTLRSIPSEATLEFRGPAQDGEFALLRIRVFDLPGPRADTSVSVQIRDGIEADAKRDGVLDADFGPVAVDAQLDQLRLNQRAVVLSSELTWQPLDDATLGYASGRFRGTLRPATGYDRSTSCEGDDRLYVASSGRCRPVGEDTIFYLGCTFRPEAPRRSGRMVYSWSPWWTNEFEVGDESTECSAIRDGTLIRVRALRNVGPSSSRPWLLEVALPRYRVVDDVTIELFGEASATIWPIDAPDRERPLFDIEPTEPGRPIQGAIRIDDERPGRDGRFLAWIEGVVGPPL